MDPSTKLRNLDIARASSQIIVIMLPALVESQWLGRDPWGLVAGDPDAFGADGLPNI